MNDIEKFKDKLLDKFGNICDWNDFAEFTFEEIGNIIDSVAEEMGVY